MWADDLMRKRDPQKQDRASPLTYMVTNDEQSRKTAFAVREGWTYENAEDGTRPQWVFSFEYRPHPITGKLDQDVLVGIQLEDGPRLERRVRIDTSEHRLKLRMWKEPGRPRTWHHLHIRNAKDESVEEYRTSCQWTYILRRKPRGQAECRRREGRLDEREE
jgi:hypothetical protein